LSFVVNNKAGVGVDVLEPNCPFGGVSEAINPWVSATERKPAEISVMVLESGEGALARNKAAVKIMVGFMSSMCKELKYKRFILKRCFPLPTAFLAEKYQRVVEYIQSA
jgi:hypothetical protein